ncbi:MAG: DUF456 family protein [Tepidisphaera sp.]|nr:DUF456 family protein [Tepidisphaera sp.]
MTWLHNVDWAHWTAATLLVVVSLVGIVLTLLTLPGTWLIVLAALLVKLWQPGMLSWWVIGAAIGLAILGEVVEFGASALGATKGGASKRGAAGAVIGSLLGALIGSIVPPFPLGTIVGGVLGAGVGTLLVEKGVVARSWKDAAKSGSGAAAGRLLATVAKTSLACVIAILVSVAGFF